MKRLQVGAMAVLLSITGVAWAAPAVPEMGRYRPLYPGLYGSAAISRDARDSSFDANGREHDTAQPSLGGSTEFPRTMAVFGFDWTFPMFETENLPFISSRLHTARVRLRAGEADTRGSLESFIESNGLEKGSSGAGDITLEFGSFLLGTENWKEKQDTGFALLGLAGVTEPTGRHDPDAPSNIGSNERAWHALLGLHWKPAAGWLVDAGYRWQTFARNKEPAFGGAEPSQRGDETRFDFSLARRLGSSFYISAFYLDRNGGNNEYRNPQFAVNPPPPPALNTNRPTPGVYSDSGTELEALGLSLYWFMSQNLLLGLHVFDPLDGKSGEFDLPYSNEQQNCGLLQNCNPQPSGDSVRVDGLGGARSYASTAVMLTLKWGFTRTDPWL